MAKKKGEIVATQLKMIKLTESTAIGVSVLTFPDDPERRADVRTFYRKDGEWLPTAKGTTIPVGALKSIRIALQKAETEIKDAKQASAVKAKKVGKKPARKVSAEIKAETKVVKASSRKRS